MTIKAEIVADSINPDGVRITTLQAKYPKFIHGEFLTHRVFSRNSSSSRAIPVERLIQDVIDDPVIPVFWGKNQPGMQAREECNEKVYCGEGVSGSREEAWKIARDEAIYAAKAFFAAGYHKQIVNRLIEPFCHINTVVTSTEWDNFFKLRCHPDAQPEMRELADAIKLALDGSMPKRLEWGEWHLPYWDQLAEEQRIGVDRENPNPDGSHYHLMNHLSDVSLKVSVARCARVSYLTHDLKTTTIKEDLALYDRLVNADPPHLSPTEHQAQAYQTDWKNPKYPSNFHPSWLQYRKTIER